MMLGTKLTVQAHSIDQREAGIRPDTGHSAEIQSHKENQVNFS